LFSLAVERRRDMAPRPFEQPHALPGFELLDRIRHRRSRQAKILRGECEAAPLDHPRRRPYGVKSVHHIVRDSRIMMTDNG
jgi:hypothetical protein